MELTEVLTNMQNDGSLQLLYQKGLISHKPFQAINIYFQVHALTKTMPKVEAVNLVATKHNLSIRTVYRNCSIFSTSISTKYNY